MNGKSVIKYITDIDLMCARMDVLFLQVSLHYDNILLLLDTVCNVYFSHEKYNHLSNHIDDVCLTSANAKPMDVTGSAIVTFQIYCLSFLQCDYLFWNLECDFLIAKDLLLEIRFYSY